MIITLQGSNDKPIYIQRTALLAFTPPSEGVPTRFTETKSIVHLSSGMDLEVKDSCEEIRALIEPVTN